MPRPRTALAIAVLGLAVAPLAGPSHAAPDQTDRLFECAKQYLITAEPPPARPVTISSTGEITINPRPTVDRAVDDVDDTVRFARCVAAV